MGNSTHNTCYHQLAFLPVRRRGDSDRVLQGKKEMVSLSYRESTDKPAHPLAIDQITSRNSHLEHAILHADEIL